MSLYYNITGNTATTLELKEFYNNSSSNPKYVYFANVHDTDPVRVDLYLTKSYKSGYTEPIGEDGTDMSKLSQDIKSDGYRKGVFPHPPATTTDFTDNKTTITYYFVKGLVIPLNTSVRFDYEELHFNRDMYTLKIRLNNSSSAVDIMIK